MRSRLAVALVSAVLLPAAGAHAGTVFDRGPGGERYVAMGDSAAAGPAIRPQRADPVSCGRSAVDFASLTAKAIPHLRAFSDVTCGGATIDDLRTAQGDNPPQLDALGPATTIVTLGPIGANDAGIVPAVVGCLRPGCRERDGSKYRRAIDATRPELAAALRAIRSRAPNALLLVVGYGRYLPPGACPDTQPVTPSDGDYVQGLVDRMDEVLRGSAGDAGAGFVDLRRTPGALEHTACAPAGQKWLQGVVPDDDDSIAFHPSALGMRNFARPVTAAIRRALSPPTSQRRVTLRLRGHGRAKHVRAVIDGSRVEVVRKGARRFVVSLRGRACGRVTVRVSARVDGRRRSVTRRVRACPSR